MIKKKGGGKCRRRGTRSFMYSENHAKCRTGLYCAAMRRWNFRHGSESKNNYENEGRPHRAKSTVRHCTPANKRAAKINLSNRYVYKGNESANLAKFILTPVFIVILFLAYVIFSA